MARLQEPVSPTAPIPVRRPFLLALVALGAALRIWQYVGDTSLWFDELSIVRNLVGRSAGRLLREPLVYDQVAPVGFMLGEKAVGSVFGTSDLAYRFPLLLVGLASLWLFLRFAERVLSGWAVPFAVAAFSIGVPFIRWSAEIKPYGIDLAAALAFGLLSLRLRDPDATAARCVRAGLLAWVIVWFSQGTVIVLAGYGGILLLEWVLTRDPNLRRAVRITVPLWAGAAAAAAFIAIRQITPETREYMDRFWRARDSFGPVPPLKAADALWPWTRVESLFGIEMLRYPWGAVYAALAILGFVLLWRRAGRFRALVVLAPLLAAFAVAIAQKYPFRSRMVLFVLPVLLIGIAESAETVRRAAARRHPALGAVLMAALFVGPILPSLIAQPPYEVEGHKKALAFLREHRRPGDDVFVFSYEIEAVERYGAQYGLSPADYRVGSCSIEDRRVFLRDVDAYRGRPRVWVFAGAVPPYQPLRSSMEKYLETIGVLRKSFSVPSQSPLSPVSARLYDLSDPARLERASSETFPVEPPNTFPVRCGDRLAPLGPVSSKQ